jgi:adenylate kinase
VRKEVSKELSNRYGLIHLSVGELLRDEVEKNGKLASQIMSSWKEGTYVKDSTVLDLLFPELEKLENANKSYILDGAPRTHPQAIALQRAGIIPERLVVVKASEGFYKSEFLERLASYASSDLDFEVVSEVAFQEYELGIKGVVEEYAWQSKEVLCDDNGIIAAEAVNKIVLAKGRGKVPRPPPRVLIVGGPLSGKTTLTSLLADKYGLVLIAVSGLVEEAIKSRSELGKIVKEYVKSATNIPEKLLIELVSQRLAQTDCKTNGWVLDGFPATYEQCRALKNFKILPSNVFFLETTDNLVVERAKFRRMDPKTGKIYGKESVDEPDLVTLVEDNDENLRNRIHAWREETIKIHSEYSKLGKSLKAELTPNILMDNISDSLESSIQQEVSQ